MAKHLNSVIGRWNVIEAINLHLLDFKQFNEEKCKRLKDPIVSTFEFNGDETTKPTHNGNQIICLSSDKKHTIESKGKDDNTSHCVVLCGTDVADRTNEVSTTMMHYHKWDRKWVTVMAIKKY